MAAVLEPDMRASDSFFISSLSKVAFSSVAANSAASFCRISSKSRSFRSGVMLDGTCMVAVKSGAEAVV